MSGVLLVVRLVIVHLATVTLAIHSINIKLRYFPFAIKLELKWIKR